MVRSDLRRGIGVAQLGSAIRLRILAAESTAPRAMIWAADDEATSVSAIGTTGCQVALTSPTAVVGNQTANVDWVAFGDPVVSLVVNVDWTAIGR